MHTYGYGGIFFLYKLGYMYGKIVEAFPLCVVHKTQLKTLYD